MQVSRVIDAGQGLLVIEGDDNGQVLVAVVPVASDVRNFFPPDQHDSDGVRLPDAQSRPMTEAELVTYAEQLLSVAGAPPSTTLHILYSA